MVFKVKKITPIDQSGDPQKLAQSVTDLAQYIEDEFAQVANAIQTDDGAGSISFVPPTKPRTAQLLYADGTHWNPGSGEGYYAYGSDAAWHWLEAPDQSAAVATLQGQVATLQTQVAALQTKTTGYEAAWSTYTPTINASSGTFTTVSATGRFLAIGKTVFINIEITITTVGTATGQVQATLPFTPKTAQGSYTIVGRERALTNKELWGALSPSTGKCSTDNYDNTSAIAAGAILVLTGVYEAA